MTMIDHKLKQIIAIVLNIDPDDVTSQTNAETTENWDSLAHLSLIMEIESAYEIKFLSEQIPNLTSVDQIEILIEKMQE